MNEKHKYMLILRISMSRPLCFYYCDAYIINETDDYSVSYLPFRSLCYKLRNGKQQLLLIVPH